MIGRIMSEAAHSIIGMFSAKPLDMEQDTSNSDFSSLLRSSDERAYFDSDHTEIDEGKIDIDMTNSAPAQNWQATILLPTIDRNFGKLTLGQEVFSPQMELEHNSVDLVASVKPEGKLPSAFIQKVLITPELNQGTGVAIRDAELGSHLAKTGNDSDILPQQRNIAFGNSSHIDTVQSLVTPNVADSRPHSDPSIENARKAKSISLTQSVTTGQNSLELPVEDMGQSKTMEDARNRQKLSIVQSESLEDAQLKFLQDGPEKPLDNAIFPSSDKALRHLQSLQPQTRNNIGVRAAPDSEISKSVRFEYPDLHGNEVQEESDIRKQPVASLISRTKPAGNDDGTFHPTVSKAGEELTGLVELGKFGFATLPKGLLPLSTANLQKTAIGGGAFIEPVKLDTASTTETVEFSNEQRIIANSIPNSAVREPMRKPMKLDVSNPQPTNGIVASKEPIKLDVSPVIKTAELSTEPQALSNPSPNMVVREVIQKPMTFDMSSPKIAERLAAQILDVSVNGGMKQFEINPRNLGRMEIIFNTGGSSDTIEIQTEHRATKDIIAQHGQQLQDILKSQGCEDLTIRIDVKENHHSSSRADGTSLSQQENRDAREQHSRPTQRRQLASSFDTAAETDPKSDNSRYA